MDQTLKKHDSVIDTHDNELRKHDSVIGSHDNELRKHDEILDEHDDEICHIRQDLVDIKTRLGIKDLTNGQVQKYQEELIKSVVEEKMERKEQDAILREDIKSVDSKTWYILTGVILSILLEIGFILFRGG